MITGMHDRGPRLPSLGRRGEGWVAGQVALIAAVFLAPLAGRGWSARYELAAECAGGALLALGLGLLAAGGLRLGRSLTPFPAPQAGQRLRTTGPYALVRHPMYGGGILIALGWTVVFASLPGLGLTVVLAVFLDLKARREEAWLVEELEGYADYRARTRRRLLPFLY